MLSLHADLCVPDLDVMIFSVGNGDGEGQNPEDEEYRAKQSQTLHASKLALGSRLWNPVLAVDEPISHSTVALKLNRAESPMGPCESHDSFGDSHYRVGRVDGFVCNCLNSSGLGA